ncbi:hypothetical protein OF83DRAFT_155940 [Amylostereum chailletii]|nr:hypothetical protein OF83DRAFT_155940 [Amylostereum chailletii]
MSTATTNCWLSVARERGLMDQPVSGSPTCEEVDEDIANLKNVLYLMLRHRNTHYPPISRIPPEILLLIFRLLHDGSTKDLCSQLFDDNPSRPKSHSTWISVTHVCRQWREVALNSPFLWTDIFCPMFPRLWTEEIIKRSSETLLACYLRAREGSNDKIGLKRPHKVRVKSIWRKCVPRLQDLHIQFDEHAFSRSWFCKPIPALESATLVNFGTTVANGHLLMKTFCLAPRLTSLKLYDCYLHRDSPILGQLTRLTMEFDNYPCPPLTIAEMNTFFQRLPVLHTLTVCEFFPTDLPVQSMHRKPLHPPPSLSHLCVRMIRRVIKSMDYVRCLESMPQTRLTLEMPHLLEAPSTALEECLTQHSLVRPEALAVSSSPLAWHSFPSDAKATHISLGVRRTRWPDSPPSRVPCAQEHLPSDDFEAIWKQFKSGTHRVAVANPTFYGVKLGRVVDLYVDVLVPQQPEVWLSLLRHAPNIERLYVNRCTALDIFASFDSRTTHTVSEKGNTLCKDSSPISPLQRLQSLCIVDDAIETDAARDKVGKDQLMTYLLARKREGARLREVQLPDTGRDGESEHLEWVDKVRALVDTVRWSRAGFY